MCSIECANLYVEKYTNGNLLLDFTVEKEFIYFRNNRDYNENMKLREYTPSMLLFQNIKNLPLSEGDIITVPMETLISHKENYNANYYVEVTRDEIPYNLFMIFSDSSWLIELFQSGAAFKNNRLRHDLIVYVEETWPEGSPCALNCMMNDIHIEVVDVGQGSTNLIYNNYNLAIFDFGASIAATRIELKCIVDKLQSRFRNLNRASLIISHWDCDHYNLLTVMDKEELEQFCCVFVPSAVISLTAKQVVKKIQKNCNFIRSFTSPIPQKSRNSRMVPVITQPNYTLYIGERCNDVNKSGLALVVKGKDEVTILGADHTNKQVWNYIYQHMSKDKSYERLNVVVPHHGGKCGKINIKKLSEKAGIAAISVGKNTYKHPNQSTIDVYDELGFDVKRTDWERKNITICMK